MRKPELQSSKSYNPNHAVPLKTGLVSRLGSAVTGVYVRYQNFMAPSPGDIERTIQAASQPGAFEDTGPFGLDGQLYIPDYVARAQQILNELNTNDEQLIP